MSVQTELQRIIQAKADIVTSIENKGVTVPSGTTIDNLDDYVDQIQQGGGGGEEWTANECFWIQSSSPSNSDEIMIRHYYDTSSTNTNPYNIWYQLTDVNEEPNDNNWIKMTSISFKTNGKKVWLYGENLQGFNYVVGETATHNYHTIGIDFKVNGLFGSSTINYTAGGHIMSLISKTKLAGMPVNAFTDFFLGNKITDASNIILPNFTSDYCYYQMFKNCTVLTTPPILPATTLCQHCYDKMFYGCTALTTAPALPATTMVNNCYQGMFYGCTALTTAPVLPATTLATACYYQMFYGCSSLTTAPELPATTLTNNCYRDMFQSCTTLTVAPELPATTLVSYCYNKMFNGCTNLNYVKCLATDISASACTTSWLNAVAATGTFIKDASMSSWTTGTAGIPSGWTVQDAA